MSERAVTVPTPYPCLDLYRRYRSFPCSCKATGCIYGTPVVGGQRTGSGSPPQGAAVRGLADPGLHGPTRRGLQLLRLGSEPARYSGVVRILSTCCG